MSALALQGAIYTRLSTGTRTVYDEVPDTATLPYIVIGNDTIVADNTDSYVGFEATVTIHTWSDFNGYKEIKTMQDEIYNLLNRHELVITGYNTINCIQEYSEPFLDPDGITRHGVQRFRVLFNQ